MILDNVKTNNVIKSIQIRATTHAKFYFDSTTWVVVWTNANFAQ